MTEDEKGELSDAERPELKEKMFIVELVSGERMAFVDEEEYRTIFGDVADSVAKYKKIWDDFREVTRPLNNVSYKTDYVKMYLSGLPLLKTCLAKACTKNFRNAQGAQ